MEALVRSPNVAVRETVLPDLLDGSRAGPCPGSPTSGWPLRPPVRAEALERGWHLHGRLDQVLNLQWVGYVVLCPVWFAAPTGAARAWLDLAAQRRRRLAPRTGPQPPPHPARRPAAAR